MSEIFKTEREKESIITEPFAPWFAKTVFQTTDYQVVKDLERQKKGMDCIIGDVIVDFKFDYFKNEKNFVFEVMQMITKTNWLDDSVADYIVYVKMYTGIAYIIDTKVLRYIKTTDLYKNRREKETKETDTIFKNFILGQEIPYIRAYKWDGNVEFNDWLKYSQPWWKLY